MIISNRASLQLSSSTHTAAAVTRQLGIEPQDEREDYTAQDTDSESSPYPISVWTIWAPRQVFADDATGLAAIRWLLALLEGKEEQLRGLAEHYEVDLTWSGTTDHRDNRVQVPHDVLARATALGCSLTIGFQWDQALLIDWPAFERD